MDLLVRDLAFVMLFVLVLITALWLFRVSEIPLTHFSIPSFFIVSYLVSAYVGILALYFAWDWNRVVLNVADPYVVFKLFLYSSMSLLLTIAGFIYGRKVIGFRINVVKNLPLARANVAQRTVVGCLLVTCALVFLAYLRQVDSIALLVALQESASQAEIARNTMGTTFAGKYWRYELFFRPLLDFCTIFFFVDLLTTKRSGSLLTFAISFLLASTTAVVSIERGPFVKLLIMVYVAYVIFKGGRYWQRMAKYGLAAVLAYLTIHYVYVLGSAAGSGLLRDILSRVFTGQIAPAYFYVDLFPARFDYLWGTSLPNPGGLLPFESFPLTETVALFMVPEGHQSTVIGTAPTVFWAEMYANFGVAGVIVSSFLVGIGLTAIAHVFARLPLSPTTVAAVVVLAMHYRTLVGTGLSSFLFDMELLAITMVTMVLLLLKSNKVAIVTRPQWV